MRIDEFDKIKKYFGNSEGIHGKEEYFNSAVLVLLIPIEGEYNFVLQKRCASIRQGGEICFPGGKVEKSDKTLEQTAIRETAEEMGIPEAKLQIIGRLNTIVTSLGATVDAFMATAKISIEEIHINQAEVENIVTIPVSYFVNTEPERYSIQVKNQPSYIDEETGEEIILLPAEQLGLPDMYKKPWGDFKHTVYVYKTEQAVIWGITARLIYECVFKIKNLMSESI